MGSGRFRDVAAFLQCTVSQFVAVRQNLGYGKDEVDGTIADAIASLDRGEGMDGDEFFAQSDKEAAELNRSSA